MTAINIVRVPPPDQNTTWVSKDYGIRAKGEFELHANRSTIEKATDLGSCQLRGAMYTASAGQKLLDTYQNSITFPKFDDQTPIGNLDDIEKVSLAIFFHGLNGNPTVWDKHVAILKKHPEIDLYVPEVPEAGQKSLTDNTSDVLLGRIVDWTNKHPGKPVAFFGQSNGTRHALHFEILLREHSPKTPVHFSLTAGVLYGTSTVSIANTLLRTNESKTLSCGVASLVNCQELAFGSDTARKLVGDARKPLEDGVAERDYTMYSPMHDVLVPDTGSGLPILVCDGQKSKKEKQYLVTNYGHNGIVSSVAEKQINHYIKWMKATSS